MSRAAGLERFAALRAGLRRKERISFFASPALALQLASSPRDRAWLKNTSRPAARDWDLHAANGVESHPLQKRQRMGHPRYRGSGKGGPPARWVSNQTTVELCQLPRAGSRRPMPLYWFLEHWNYFVKSLMDILRHLHDDSCYPVCRFLAFP